MALRPTPTSSTNSHQLQVHYGTSHLLCGDNTQDGHIRPKSFRNTSRRGGLHQQVTTDKWHATGWSDSYIHWQATTHRSCICRRSYRHTDTGRGLQSGIEVRPGTQVAYWRTQSTDSNRLQPKPMLSRDHTSQAVYANPAISRTNDHV